MQIRYLLKKAMLVLAYLICISLILSVIISNRLPVLHAYELAFEDLPKEFDGFTVLQLSDLHSAEFGVNNHVLLNMIRKKQPDLVALTGDMICSIDHSYETFFTFAAVLAAEFDTYFIPGNHEQALGDRECSLFCQRVESLGITVLDNESRLIEQNGAQIRLYGLWFNLRYYNNRSNEQAEQYHFSLDSMTTLLGTKQPEFSLLLTHNPLYFETYADWGADLILAGHMHGGMVRLPVIGGVYSPDRTLFPTYDAGLFTQDDSTMIVSRGLGAGNTGFRLFNQPELISITLKTTPKQ